MLLSIRRPLPRSSHHAIEAKMCKAKSYFNRADLPLQREYSTEYNVQCRDEAPKRSYILRQTVANEVDVVHFGLRAINAVTVEPSHPGHILKRRSTVMRSGSGPNDTVSTWGQACPHILYPTCQPVRYWTLLCLHLTAISCGWRDHIERHVKSRWVECHVQLQ